MKKSNSIFLLLGFTLASCATGGNKNPVLGQYVGKQVYPISRKSLANYVVNDLKKNHRWHDDDNYIFSALRGAPMDIKFTIRGSSADLREVEELIANNGASRTQVSEQETSSPGSRLAAKPIEIWSAHEIYILQKVDGNRDRSTLMIQSQSDRSRLYDRELEVYNEVDHEGAAALRQRIHQEHPEVELQPLG